MKKLKTMGSKIWNYSCVGFAGILSAVLVLSLILFFTNNILVYEPLYNLLLLIGLLLSMILYILAKTFDAARWRRNWLMTVTALNFIMVILVFINFVGFY